MVVYSPDRNQCIFTTIGADRSIGAAILPVVSFSGLQVYTYLGILSADGKILRAVFLPVQ